MKGGKKDMLRSCREGGHCLTPALREPFGAPQTELSFPTTLTPLIPDHI